MTHAAHYLTALLGVLLFAYGLATGDGLGLFGPVLILGSWASYYQLTSGE